MSNPYTLLGRNRVNEVQAGNGESMLKIKEIIEDLFKTYANMYKACTNLPSNKDKGFTKLHSNNYKGCTTNLRSRLDTLFSFYYKYTNTIINELGISNNQKSKLMSELRSEINEKSGINEKSEINEKEKETVLDFKKLVSKLARIEQKAQYFKYSSGYTLTDEKTVWKTILPFPDSLTRHLLFFIDTKDATTIQWVPAEKSLFSSGKNKIILTRDGYLMAITSSNPSNASNESLRQLYDLLKEIGMKDTVPTGGFKRRSRRVKARRSRKVKTRRAVK